MPDDLIFPPSVPPVDPVDVMTKKDRDAGVTASVQWEYENVLVDAARMVSELNRYGRLGWEAWGVLEAVKGHNGRPALGVAMRRQKNLLVLAKTIT